MAKYKNVKPEILEGFLDAIFGAVAKERSSAAIDALKKKDRNFAANYKKLQKLRDKFEKELKASGVDPDDEVADIKRRLRKLK